jgi:outer membrane protein TolC
MNGPQCFLSRTGFVLCLLAGMPLQAASLTLAEAERIALENDPMLAGIYENARAYSEQSVADSQLPDPKLKLGLMNYPVDSFNRVQEPMTQMQIGVQQAFPPGQSLHYKSRGTALMGEVEQALARDRALGIRKQVREFWLETYYWTEAGNVVRANQRFFDQLVNITRSRYVVGAQNQQDVIRAELELELLKDRETRIHTMQEKNRAELARFIGSAHGTAELSADLPALAAIGDLEMLKSGLEQHPAMHAASARVSASQQAVAMARENYKPAWMLDVTYGDRGGENPNGSDRADFLSAMVMVDVPLFTGNRQDRRLAASQHRANASMHVRDTRFLELNRELDKLWTDWQRLGERLQRYDSALLPQAHENALAALNAYQSDRGDFTMLMRARITEIETQLQALRVRIDHAKAQAGLLYLSGEEK